MSVDELAVHHHVIQMTPSMVSKDSSHNSDDQPSSATSTPPKSRAGMNRAGKMSLQGSRQEELLNNYRRFSRCSTSSAGASDGSQTDIYGISLAEHLKLTR